jgi:hypothetical protein
MLSSEIHPVGLIHMHVVTTTVLKLADVKPFSIGTHLDSHSWKVSSEVYPVGLSLAVKTTELKSVSHGLGRFETCRRLGVFSIGMHLDIHLWIVSLEPYPVGLGHVVTATELKSVSGKFKTCRRMRLFLCGHTSTLTHG